MCSSCRKAPTVRRPNMTGGVGGIVPTPSAVNRAVRPANDKEKITKLRYVPR